MKKNLIYLLSLLLFCAAFTACSEDDLDSTSVIREPQVVKNDFDRWLDRHYMTPYNIEFQYRYSDIESSMGYYLTPADYNQSIALAKLVIALCLEPYDEVTGSREFIRSYFPKILFLTGSPAYKSNGSIILGTAEGGKKITLFNVDALQIASINASTNYFKTIHHEFAHILNQTKPYTTDFKEITGTLYVGDACWDTYKTDAAALQLGLISRYAGSEDTEDFVELISIYVTRPQATWDSLLTTAGTAGASIINQKFEIVRNYLQNSWNIDIDQLRETVLRRADEVPDMDLESLDD